MAPAAYSFPTLFVQIRRVLFDLMFCDMIPINTPELWHQDETGIVHLGGPVVGQEMPGGAGKIYVLIAWKIDCVLALLLECGYALEKEFSVRVP